MYWNKKKVFAIAFRQVLTKILPAACIQLDNLPESYARYLPSYQKCQKIVASTRCGCPPAHTPASSPEPLLGTLGMGKNLTQQPKMYCFPPSEKSLLIDLKLLLSKVSFLPHQIAILK